MPQPDAAAEPLMRPLRLAVDARDAARDGRGIGTYARALLTRFARRDDVALTLLVRDWFPARATGALRAAIGADASRPIRFDNRVPRDAGVVWHPWNGTFFTSSRPAVATVHDLVPFAFPAPDERRRRSQQTPILRTGATARIVVCDSAFTAMDVERYLHVRADRLRVVPLGVDSAFAPGDLDALPPELHGRTYVLYVGAHDAHKNVATLAVALGRAFPRGEVSLVFTRPNPHIPAARVFDRAPLRQLVALYRGAMLVAVPSLYEGFGLPVLEAMACGAPVLAARAASLPEVGGDVAAYVDAPRDPAAWEGMLAALFANAERRAAMGRAGVGRAASFAWERCADRTLAILRETAAASDAGAT